MNYGKGLTEIRTGLDMDTIDFADLCGVTPGTIFKYEENHEDITLKETMELCKALKIPLDFFIGLSTEPVDVPFQWQFRFTQLYPKLRDVTIMIIRADHIEGEKLDMKKYEQMMIEIHQILRNGE